jgi:predicted DNA binding protein
VKYIDVTLELPPEFRHPMEQFLQDSTAVSRIEILAWDITPASVEYILAYAVGSMEPYRERAESVRLIRDVTLSPIDEGSFYVYVCQETREADTTWRQVFEGRNLVTVPPVVYDDSGAHITVVGSPEDLQTLTTGMPETVNITVEEVGDYDRRHTMLAAEITDRQFEAVSIAVDMGYYHVPRDGDLADVAEALGCAESTTSQLLRKAEGSVMRRIVGTA